MIPKIPHDSQGQITHCGSPHPGGGTGRSHLNQRVYNPGFWDFWDHLADPEEDQNLDRRRPPLLTRLRPSPTPTGFPPPVTLDSGEPEEKMLDIKAWAEYIVEWAAKDPYGFLTTVILALTPLFVISAALSWKLAKMIEAREREQKKKQKRQENIAKAKRTKKD
ncbi:hypothetical protein WISP_09683 [Willisornis vidua]|nr:hypothetical protein WISP_09683 [Willisornis vidua]